jgi:hypothetical protein
MWVQNGAGPVAPSRIARRQAYSIRTFLTGFHRFFNVTVHPENWAANPRHTIREN